MDQILVSSRPVSLVQNFADPAQNVLKQQSNRHHSSEIQKCVKKCVNFHKDLGMKIYKVHSVQELKPNEYTMCFRFAR